MKILLNMKYLILPLITIIASTTASAQLSDRKPDPNAPNWGYFEGKATGAGSPELIVSCVRRGSQSVPALALGMVVYTGPDEIARVMGSRERPTRGFRLSVSGTTADGPFSFSTNDTGHFGTTNQWGGIPVVFAGGGITHDQVRLIMRARSLQVVAGGLTHEFGVNGSAREISRLTCSP